MDFSSVQSSAALLSRQATLLRLSCRHDGNKNSCPDTVKSGGTERQRSEGGPVRCSCPPLSPLCFKAPAAPRREVRRDVTAAVQQSACSASAAALCGARGWYANEGE
ncbi:hypothetical protein MHYP_G00189950 [Metynnis hypsauchen]